MTMYTSEDVELFDEYDDFELAEMLERTVTAIKAKRERIKKYGQKGNSMEYVAYDYKGEVTYSASSIVELAELLGVKPTSISRTLTRYKRHQPACPKYGKFDISMI